MSQITKMKKQKRNKSQELTVPSLTEIDNEARTIDLKEAMKKQNDVSMFLTRKVISTIAKNINFVFSPTSINTVLTMVAASCEEEDLKSFLFSFLQCSSIGELCAVSREITSMVLADGSMSGGPKISAVNGVWMEQSLPFSPSSKDLLVNFFKAYFAKVDFLYKAEQVRMEVNTLVSNHTNGLINNLLPQESVTSDTKWIYGNALYFKGVWKRNFTKSMTSQKPFHRLNGKSVHVPFMKSYKNQYITEYDDDFKVLKLRYQQGRDETDRNFSMYFYLPDKKHGMNNLLERMTSTPGILDTHNPLYKVEVGEFRIPKFKIEFRFEASKVFDEIELKFSLYQKALIEMDEEGTEVVVVTASVGTRVDLCARPIKPKKIDFVADHPFVFLIREDKTGTVLFAGQIFDPSKSSFA